MKTVKTAPAPRHRCFKSLTLLAMPLMIALALAACAGAPAKPAEKASETRGVWFGNLVDGQTVASPFTHQPHDALERRSPCPT